MRNYITNHRFKVGQSPQALTGSGAYVASRMWIGPGIGGACSVTFPAFQVGQTDVPNNPEFYLRSSWSSAPSSGESQYLPDFRWTWFEHHITQAKELVGATVNYKGFLRVATGTVYVKPIIWVNYAVNDYTIYDQSGVVIGTNWTEVSGSFSIPQYPLNKVLDTSNYVGFGYDFLYQTAPVIDIAPINFWLPNEMVTETPYWLDIQFSA